MVFKLQKIRLVCSYLFCCVIVGLTSCRSACTVYPDQKCLFLSKPENKGYFLAETSVYEINQHDQWGFDCTFAVLRRVRENFESNPEVVRFIDQYTRSMKEKESLIMKQTDEDRKFLRNLRKKDRLFKYFYENESIYEKGILILRDGEIIYKSSL